MFSELIRRAHLGYGGSPRRTGRKSKLESLTLPAKIVLVCIWAGRIFVPLLLVACLVVAAFWR
jgi:hypothetical protein